MSGPNGPALPVPGVAARAWYDDMTRHASLHGCSDPGIVLATERQAPST